ncbi:DinB family protein [Patescibacteria group bacterium]|nr:DinB family protein [Patescibacteria group bacterium]
MNDSLFQEIKAHWLQLRGMTYDLLGELKSEDLDKKLPFPTSQDILYQFNCMIGAQESNIPLITKGAWEGFSSSLDKEPQKTIEVIKKHMQEADNKLFEALQNTDLLRKFSDGSSPLMNYMMLVEHEAHHQGQLINFIYACDLPIPKSWADKWALSK